MGQPGAPRTESVEGRVAGIELNSFNGRRYTFEGHFLGDGTIVYRATILDADGGYRGELSGVFEHVETGPSPRAQVESLVKAAIREAVGYRP